MSTKALAEGQVIIPKARLGYPRLFKAERVKNDPNGTPRYNCAFYIPKSDEATKAKLDKEIDRLAKLHLKGVKPKTAMLPLKDGDGEDGDENTKGFWILNANRTESQGRPQVVDRQNKAIDSADARSVYGGCWVDGLVGIYFQKQWGRICCGLEVVRKLKDDTSFGAAPVDVDEVMPELPAEEDDEDYGV